MSPLQISVGDIRRHHHATRDESPPATSQVAKGSSENDMEEPELVVDPDEFEGKLRVRIGRRLVHTLNGW